MPVPTTDIMRRLAFIRYLYTNAVLQSRQPHPQDAASILLFHDAVELFNHLAVEHTGAKSRSGMQFMEYWESFPGLTQKESMRRLNEARIGLKHHGNLPSSLDIEGFRGATTTFLEDNTPTVFGLSFDSISMIGLIKYENAKIHLEAAQGLIERQEYDQALGEIAFAFRFLVREYEQRSRDKYGQSPFFFGRSYWRPPARSSLISRGAGGTLGVADRQWDREMERWTRDLTEAVETIQESIKVMSLGLDYRRYARFKQLTPHVIELSAGQIGRTKLGRESPTREECHIAIDFVIESALALQEVAF